MDIKGINFNSVNGEIIGEVPTSTIYIDAFKNLPSYSPSDNSYGFSQFAVSSVNKSGSENEVIQGQLKFTNYPYYDGKKVVTVYDDNDAFSTLFSNSFNIDIYNFTSGIRLISSFKINDNLYINTVVQKPDEARLNVTYYAAYSYICDNDSFVPSSLLRDYSIGSAAGSGTFQYTIIYSYRLYDVLSDKIELLGIQISNPIFVEMAETNFYEGESYLFFCPFTILNQRVLAPDKSSGEGWDPTYLDYQYMYEVNTFNKLFGIKIDEDIPPDDPDIPIVPSDPIDVPDYPPVNPITSGLVNAYLMTYEKLQQFHEEIFPTFTEEDFDENPLVNLANEIKWIWKTLKSGMSNNYIISCHGIPITPTTSGSENIKLGNFEYSTIGQKISSGYIDFDFGSINIAEYYKNYADYSNTSIQLFLPFGIGYVQIEPEYVQNGILKVIYRFNVADGSFMAYVISTSSKSELSNSIIAQYTGTCVSNIPMTGSNYSSLVSNVITSGVSAIASNNPTSLLNLATDTAVESLSPSVKGSNDMTVSNSMLTVRYPYLLISRDVLKNNENYKKINGAPLIEYGQVKNFKGLCHFELNLNDINIDCIDYYKEEILKILKNGIVIK